MGSIESHGIRWVTHAYFDPEPWFPAAHARHDPRIPSQSSMQYRSTTDAVCGSSATDPGRCFLNGMNLLTLGPGAKHRSSDRTRPLLSGAPLFVGKLSTRRVHDWNGPTTQNALALSAGRSPRRKTVDENRASTRGAAPKPNFAVFRNSEDEREEFFYCDI